MDHSYQRDNIYQIIEAIINELSYDGDSKSIIADILISILETTPYTGESPKSVIGQLLLKLKDKLEGNDPEPYEDTGVSNIAKILISIINETEYTDPPRSNIAELLLELKEKLETLVEITVTGNPVTFTTNVSKPLKACSVNIPVMQEGSGDPSPDNVRNFIGVSSFDFIKADKNIFFSTDITNGVRRELRPVLLQAGTYTLTADIVSEDTEADTCLIYDASNSTQLGNIERGSRKSITFTTDKVIENIWFYASRNNTLSTGKTFSFTNIQIEVGSTATDYEPYNGQSKTFNFGQTVYVVNTDILTGKSFVTHEINTIDDNTSIAVSNGIFAVDNFFDISNDTESVGCNVYQRGENRTNTAGVMTNNPDFSFCCRLGSTPTRVMIKDTRFSTVEGYKTWLSTNPVKIAVKLVTPIEIDLEGMSIITNIGENNLLSNIGDISATYLYKNTNE